MNTYEDVLEQNLMLLNNEIQETYRFISPLPDMWTPFLSDLIALNEDYAILTTSFNPPLNNELHLQRSSISFFTTCVALVEKLMSDPRIYCQCAHERHGFQTNFADAYIRLTWLKHKEHLYPLSSGMRSFTNEDMRFHELTELRCALAPTSDRTWVNDLWRVHFAVQDPLNMLPATQVVLEAIQDE